VGQYAQLTDAAVGHLSLSVSPPEQEKPEGQMKNSDEPAFTCECVCACVCACTCVCARERERE